jgi:photosystem II stability/assembly factor-like uncharacterized protein
MLKRAAILLTVLAAAVRLHAGAFSWTTHGPSGGSVFFLTIDPKSPNTLYAISEAGAANALYVSHDGAQSWARIHVPDGYVSAVAVDAARPVIYAAIDGNVFVSLDDGSHWSETLTGAALGVAALVADPNIPGIVYAGMPGLVLPGHFVVQDASWSSLQKSVDGGETWMPTGSVGVANQVLVAPSDSRIVYVSGTYGAGGDYRGEILRSTDGGETFTPLAVSGYGVAILSLDPKNANIFYATDGRQGLDKTVDAGNSFTQITSLPAPLLPYPEPLGTLAIDPLNPQTLYLAAGDPYAGSVGIYRSLDGGAAWSRQDQGIRENDVYSLVIDPSAPSTLYVAGPGVGVSKSTDAGVTWSLANAGISTARWTAVAVSPADPNLLYAGGDNLGIYRSTDQGESWQPTVEPPSHAVSVIAVAPSKPSVIYAAADTVLVSQDSGASWQGIGSALPQGGASNCVAVDPANARHALVCSWGQGIYETLDGGTTWAQRIYGFRRLWINAIAFDPSNSSIAYAAADGVYKSVDGGRNWAPYDDGLPTPNPFQPSIPVDVSALAIDPRVTTTVYASAGSYGIFKSIDGGLHWSQIFSPPASDDAVGSILVDPMAPSNVYAATSQGVIRSADGGLTWSPLNPGAPFLADTLAIDGTGHTLHAAASGGIFEFTLLSRDIRPLPPSPPRPVAAPKR